jgi:Uma2 family endonuclease
MGDLARTEDKVWTAKEFLRTDQREFGDAWRYELVDGRIVAHAAPTPAHAKIVVALGGALTARMTGKDGCFPESGSGAAPENQQQANARIPDVMIRSGGLPRVLFEVLSPSELKRWRERDRKRLDEQDIAGVEEIIEIYQSEPAIHIYRRGSGHWVFEPVGGLEAMLELRSVALTIPLVEIYRYIDFDREAAEL